MACFIIVLLVCYWLAAPPAAVSFETARELRAFAAANGLETCNDIGNEGLTFFIGDHPIRRNDIAPLCSRRDCGLTPIWRGVVWAAQIRTSLYTIEPEQSSRGHWRVWGNVTVGGDEQLMDRIEELYLGR
jgi:hypothetical protein